MLRQLAYQQKCAVPGPDIDPQGWKSLKSVSVSGIMSKSRKVEAACKVGSSCSLARISSRAHMLCSLPAFTFQTSQYIPPSLCYSFLTNFIFSFATHEELSFRAICPCPLPTVICLIFFPTQLQ